MKLHYHPETDSLYIDLSDKASVDTREVAPGVVLDFDAAGNLVGIDIDHASEIVTLSRLEAEGRFDERDAVVVRKVAWLDMDHGAGSPDAGLWSGESVGVMAFSVLLQVEQQVQQGIQQLLQARGITGRLGGLDFCK